MSTAAPAVETTELVEQTRARRARRLPRRHFAVASALALLFLGVTLPLALLPEHVNHPSPLTFAMLVLAYAVVSRVHFEIGTGAAVPTQLILVPMLFLLPVGLVPVAVAAGIALGSIVPHLRREIPLQRSVLYLSNGWHAVGPAAVLIAAGVAAPSWGRWPLYLAALAAQFAVDLASAVAWNRLALGVKPLAQLRAMAQPWAVDAALAPLGLLVAFVAADEPAALLLVLPLVGLLNYFARERRTRIDHALELSHAYRGTALLLGDVVEADDAYTGSHSRDVVDLVLGVCDELNLSPSERRDAEFVALLHDVGKIRVPGEIINKPGPLDDEEWRVMKTHTVEGERMLSGVGGLLAHVGGVVRSCHERWDGAGYPDGLAGDEIPLLARIVMACDAYSAMTTDRSYRRAMSDEAAVAQLRAN